MDEPPNRHHALHTGWIGRLWMGMGVDLPPCRRLKLYVFLFKLGL